MPPEETADVLLRPLRRDDIDRVLVLEAALFGPGAWTRGILEDELAAPGRRYVAVECDGVVAGYAGMSIAEESHLMTIGVDPAARRQGHASAMLRDLLQAARAAGATSVILEVRADDDGAQALYRGFGFEPIGLRPRYYQVEGVDAVVMRAVLS